MRILTGIVILIGLCCMCQAAQSQDTSSLYNRLHNFPEKFFQSINSKSEKLQNKVLSQTEKYLARLERQERRLKKKLARKDTLAAEQLFGNINERYAALREQLQSKSSGLSNLNSDYSGHVDSMKTVLSFLQQQRVLQSSDELQKKLGSAIQCYSAVQGQFAKVQDIKKILKERQAQLQAEFENFGMVKELKALKKQVYYYRAQMDEYRNIFSNPSRIEEKALELAGKIPAFKDFFGKYSDIASVPSTPGNSITALQGLQSRANVQQLLQHRMTMGGPSAQQVVQQNIQMAQEKLTQLKDQITRLGGSDLDIPDFKPNHQKTRSFFKRLEFGSNLQSTKSNFFFPTTTDLGISVGFKINDQSVIGIGSSYKIGWGTDIQHIDISHQGVGIRSFLDWKIKGSFYASGGFEYNYQKPFASPQQLYNLNAWQQSGLVGVSKIISFKSKLFKKTKAQLLWDFLSYQQMPRTQAIKFRFGYTF
jgi:hypothetical protein